MFIAVVKYENSRAILKTTLLLHKTKVATSQNIIYITVKSNL